MSTVAGKCLNGLLLVGHGTRNRSGQTEFLRVVANLAGCEAIKRDPVSSPVSKLDADDYDIISGQAGWAVEPCFLELAEPTIDDAIQRLLARGIERLVVAPLLLFSAGHAQCDIPLAVQAALVRRGANPRVVQAGTLDCHPALIELASRRFTAALAGSESNIPAADTLLLYVGRGSTEATANAEFARFARLRREATPVGWLEYCYLSMTEPDLATGLEMAARLPFRRIVVQPHLLFPGQLYDEIVTAVANCRAAHPSREWLVVEPLGCDSLVSIAIWDRVRESGVV